MSPAPRDPTISVIVPTFNRRSRLERLLRAIDRLPESRSGLEVVVAIDGATDGTAEMLRDLNVGYPLQVIERPHRGRGAARNAALAAAKGDLLLFLDDDVVPTSPLISEHLRHHRSNLRAAVIGPQVAPPGLRLAPWLHWEATILERLYGRMTTGEVEPTAREFFTGNASVRRELALAAGGFNEEFQRYEDIEFGFRLAEQHVVFRFEPRAIAHHEPDRTFASWMVAPYEHGKFAVLFVNGLVPGYIRHLQQMSRDRNLLSRVLARWSVGHPLRHRAVAMVFGWLITQPAFDRLVRLKLWLCSGLVNILFWQGVADATHLGTGVWRSLDSPRPLAPPKRM